MISIDLLHSCQLRHLLWVLEHPVSVHGGLAVKKTLEEQVQVEVAIRLEKEKRFS